MKFHAKEHDLVITEKERLISGSINIHTCEFTFDSSWDGYMVTAVFSTANKLVNRAIVDGKCDIPPEVLRPNSRLRIGVFGNDGVRTKPTTYSEWIPVEQGADPSGRTGRPPEPTAYEQWMNAINEQVDDWAEADARRVIEKTSVSGEYVPAGEESPVVEKQMNEDGSMNLHFALSTGVYVGSGEMPDDCNVQIDPMGEVISMDDLMDGGIFVAEYGKTPYADIKAAWDKGKAIVCRNTSGSTYYKYCAGLHDVFISTTAVRSYFTFVATDGVNIRTYKIFSDNYWSAYNGSFSNNYASKDHTHTPEDIGAIPAVGESISDPEVNIDDLTLTKCYMCGSTVVKKGLKGDLPFNASFFLEVKDFTGIGTRAKQIATLNNTKNPLERKRLWNGTVWSAWQDG